MHVFVLDINKKPLNPCHPAVARKLLKQGRAAVFKRYPFTIILFEEKETPNTQLRLKIDPGSKVTGLTLVLGSEIVWAAELHHRGDVIRKNLYDRRCLRRGRRSRKTRYRKPRFLNRKRKDSWLAPSIESRVNNIVTWVNRLQRVAPIGAVSMELVRFDTQKMQNPEISGVKYQQGELLGYEVREYLLEKFGRTCAYCGAEETPLEVEHIHPKSKGGSNRISNLTISCHDCNKEKDNLTLDEWVERLKAMPSKRARMILENIPEVKKRAKAPLKDAAAVNAARWKLYETLKETGLPVETGTGGMTKFNRSKLELPKTHWIDAACVGASTPESLKLPYGVLSITAKGHGRRQRCNTDKYGFPVNHAPSRKSYEGFKTGDLIRAIIPKGKHKGTHEGRIAIRYRPSFKLNSFDVHPKYLRIIQKADGYEYQKVAALPPHS